MNKVVTLIIPLYNEAENILELYDVIETTFVNIPYDWTIIFVNDGSVDATERILFEMAQQKSKIKYINFSKNFGKDNALKAGIDCSNSDLVVTMDGDLQHHPKVIASFLSKYEEGFDVVYAYRKANPHVRMSDKINSFIFWKIMNLLSDVKLEDGISDFRLMSKEVVTVLKNIPENNLFFRGMVKWVGFRQANIEYIPDKRHSGETKYSKKALIKLAIHGITSFSLKPLYLAIYTGFIFSLLSLFYIPYIIASLYFGFEVSGWASLISTIVFFGGLNLTVLGIIGIYIGKMFIQTKNRPNYIIRTSNIDPTDEK
jgi:glycosyltransferase involved in cell wall biosynthesis